MTAVTHCLERNVETHLEENSFRNPDWINLSQHMDEWRAIVTIGMNILFPQRVDNFPSKGKAIPLQTLTGPEGSRKLRLPDFKTFGT
jgi:hypothetical protein